MSDRAQGRDPLRWSIAALLFLGTVVNYIDRQTIAVLAGVLAKDLHLTNTAYGKIGAWFLVCYALSMWLWGTVFDRLGNRVGYTLAIGWWSLAEMGHALARGAASLSIARGFLGVGESGNWPGATRTIAEWFSAKQRALAMGIANAGAALGSAAAPPIIVWLQLAYGWKTVFIATGAFGLVWVAAWLIVYPRVSAPSGSSPSGIALGDSHDTALEEDRPGGSRSKQLSPKARSSAAAKKNTILFRPSPAPAIAGAERRQPTWRELLKHRQVWGIILARFFGDPIWWLYLNWLPKYLFDVRGFSLKQIGAFAWVPYAVAGIGCLTGGWLSGHLLSRGQSVDRARKTAIILATVLMPVGLAAAFCSSAAGALACMSITLFGFQFWVGNVQTLASDYFPVNAVGSIAGISGTAAGLGAALFTYNIGSLVDHFSYTPVLVIAAILAPLATILLFLVAGPVRPVPIGGANPPGTLANPNAKNSP